MIDCGAGMGRLPGVSLPTWKRTHRRHSGACPRNPFQRLCTRRARKTQPSSLGLPQGSIPFRSWSPPAPQNPLVRGLRAPATRSMEWILGSEAEDDGGGDGRRAMVATVASSLHRGAGCGFGQPRRPKPQLSEGAVPIQPQPTSRPCAIACAVPLTGPGACAPRPPLPGGERNYGPASAPIVDIAGLIMSWAAEHRIQTTPSVRSPSV